MRGVSIVDKAAAGYRILDLADLDPDPIVQFGHWFEAALLSDAPEPNAMTLATATKDGLPAARIVLLKHFDQRGFVFFTNYESQKGTELAQNPHAALVLFWPALERQIRICGAVTRTSCEESESYFHARPIGSQVGAWASHQSQILARREELDARVQEFSDRFANQPIPLPPNWGGFRVTPSSLEFWQARPSRLHDRFRYTRANSGWRIDRLYP
jgi:pyridoxamine 5'-phosphate oxidase